MKISKILISVIIIFFFTSGSFAKEIKRDCSKIDTSTIAGSWEKRKCKKGLPPSEKNRIGKYFKKFWNKTKDFTKRESDKQLGN